jgi:hypothetical protein
MSTHLRRLSCWPAYLILAACSPDIDESSQHHAVETKLDAKTSWDADPPTDGPPADSPPDGPPPDGCTPDPLCGNSEIDPGETQTNCPEDFGCDRFPTDTKLGPYNVRTGATNDYNVYTPIGGTLIRANARTKGDFEIRITDGYLVPISDGATYCLSDGKDGRTVSLNQWSGRGEKLVSGRHGEPYTVYFGQKSTIDYNYPYKTRSCNTAYRAKALWGYYPDGSERSTASKTWTWNTDTTNPPFSTWPEDHYCRLTSAATNPSMPGSIVGLQGCAPGNDQIQIGYIGIGGASFTVNLTGVTDPATSTTWNGRRLQFVLDPGTITETDHYLVQDATGALWDWTKETRQAMKYSAGAINSVTLMADQDPPSTPSATLAVYEESPTPQLVLASAGSLTLSRNFKNTYKLLVDPSYGDVLQTWSYGDFYTTYVNNAFGWPTHITTFEGGTQTDATTISYDSRGNVMLLESTQLGNTTSTFTSFPLGAIVPSFTEQRLNGTLVLREEYAWAQDPITAIYKPTQKVSKYYVGRRGQLLASPEIFTDTVTTSPTSITLSGADGRSETTTNDLDFRILTSNTSTDSLTASETADWTTGGYYPNQLTSTLTPIGGSQHQTIASQAESVAGLSSALTFTAAGTTISSHSSATQSWLTANPSISTSSTSFSLTESCSAAPSPESTSGTCTTSGPTAGDDSQFSCARIPGDHRTTCETPSTNWFKLAGDQLFNTGTLDE